MSESAAKHMKEERRLCARCRDGKARSQDRDVHADRDRTLCFACFRARRADHRTVSPAAAGTTQPPRSPFGAARQPLDGRQTAHRRAMLEHFTRCAAER